LKSGIEATNNVQRAKFTFATLEDATAIISRPDDYILSMHPFERALIMQSSDVVSQDAYLTSLGEHVLAWSEDECDKLKNAFTVLDAWLGKHCINAVDLLVLIKTTGHEMWNSAYTRSNAIILPEGKLHAYPDPVALARLLAHEYFHILSRYSPRLRTDLYRLIGFHPLDGERFALPDIITRRKLTNPDAPHHDYYACLSFQGKPIRVIPITMLKQRVATVDAAQDILNSVMTRLLVVGRPSGQWTIQWQHGRPYCLDLQQVTGWREYLGDGAETVFDPEEILADCFVRLLTDKENRSAPEIRNKMIVLLADNE
jgi:hypothetical protein